VFFSLYSDITQEVFSGKTGHLTNLYEGNPCVLKDTLAEFLDVSLGPLRMGELQVALYNAPMTCIEDVGCDILAIKALNRLAEPSRFCGLRFSCFSMFNLTNILDLYEEALR